MEAETTMARTRLGPQSEDIYEALRQRIASREYEVGGKLATEEELCTMFGVSRTTVRRSLARLAEAGLIRARRGAGTVVCARPELPAATSTISLMYSFVDQELTTVQDYALNKGLLLCVFSQLREHWDLLAERQFLELVLQQCHQGLLAFCSPLEPRNDDRLIRLTHQGVRVVHIEHYRRELPDQGYLLPDYVDAGCTGTVHLLLAGYRRVLFVSRNLDAPYSQLLEVGIARALSHHRDGYDPVRDRLPVPNDFVNDHAFCAKLVAAVRDGDIGLLCENTRLGARVAQVLRQAGIRIPEDVGLIGPEAIGAPPPDPPIDMLGFDRLAILRQAIDAIVAAQLPRRLVTAQIVSHHTTRSVGR